MRPPKDFPAGTAERMRVLLKQAKDVAEQRRIQAVLMRASEALPPAKIAQLTALSVNSVRVIHSRFLREGESFLIGRPGRGGRRHSLLSEEQAQQLLGRHTANAALGKVIVADAFKRDYERLVGHKVAASTVYRLLAKAGWRKIAPGPVIRKRTPWRSRPLKKLRRTGSRRAAPLRPHAAGGFHG